MTFQRRGLPKRAGSTPVSRGFTAARIGGGSALRSVCCPQARSPRCQKSKKKAPVALPTGALFSTLIGRPSNTPSDQLFERHQVIDLPYASQLPLGSLRVSVARMTRAERCARMNERVRRTAPTVELCGCVFIRRRNLRSASRRVNGSARTSRLRNSRCSMDSERVLTLDQTPGLIVHGT